MTLSKTMRKRRGGAAVIEMTFVGIPLIFVLISIFEMSRGMWVYHTLTYAVKEGTRFAIVHGENCVPNPPTVLNNCATTIAKLAVIVQNAGVGLDLGTGTNGTSLTFYAPANIAGSINNTGGTLCYLSSAGTPPCSSLTTTWPPANLNQARVSTIEIDINVPFNSALAMFWPGWKPMSFAQVNLGASSSDRIQF
jgi:Flp pilus assembly protein TadG